MTSRHLLFFLITLAATNAFGQAPVITHVDKYINGNDQRVTISGTNFGSTLSDIVVSFGGVQGNVETVTDQTIEVNVPAGATYDNIVVTNIATGKSAQSQGEFMLSYGGESPLSLTRLTAQVDLDAETGLFDLCMCDLDGDGLNDVAGSNFGSNVGPPPNGVSIFKNNSTPGGALTFASKHSVLPNIRTLNIKCADLNGDGKKDLIVSEGDPGTRIFILTNTSSPGSLSFTSQSINIAGKLPKRIDAADLDQDGLPELVVTDQNTANKDLLIFRNTSTGGTISFDNYEPFPVPGNGSDGLTIQDLDNDNKPEIIVTHVVSSSGNVFVYKNESHPGTFVFDNVIKIEIGNAANDTGGPINVRTADIDGDQKPEILITQFLGSGISVLINQSTATGIKFADAASIATDPYPYGLDVGDLDGDGKPDVVVASLTGPSSTTKSLTILNNTSTTGSISFTRLTQPTTYINRHVVIGDLNGDAKPDIAYASVDDESNSTLASKISFFRNQNCIVPKISPDGPLTVCSSFLIPLEATKSNGAAYAWKESGSDLGVNLSSYTPSVSGSYTVEITSDGCTKTSAAVTVTVGTGTASAPAISNNSPLCEGGTINLGITTPVGGETYNWTGPAEYAQSGSSVSRASYKPEFAGRYEVEVIVNGCLAAKGFALVETISLRPFSITLDGPDVICNDTRTLSVFEPDADFTYQWADANGNISGQTATSLPVTATGSYYVKAKSIPYPACPEVVSDPVNILAAATPVADFNLPAETCRDVLTTFTNQSTVDDNAGPAFKWEFGDGDVSNDEAPTHAYTAEGNLNVKLTVSYRNDACTVTKQKPIKVSSPPTASITTPTNVFEFCDGEQITLGVDKTFSQYLWSTGETTPTIDVTEGATYTVQLKDAIGCEITASKQVTVFQAPGVDITAEKNPINLGEQTKLSASGGFAAYEWSPSETLDDATSQTPIAKPGVTTTYKVEVIGTNGCVGSDSIRLEVILDNPTNLLKISNFFSPNDDGSNPVWKVDPPEIVAMCGVIIFDEKGVKVYEAKPYNNDWDGTNNGKKLPSGVYYYIVRCDGDNGSKTGSITILR